MIRADGTAWRGRGGGVMLAMTAVSLSLNGCLALSLSSRGAPEAAMREARVSLDAVDLPGHGESHGEGVHTRPVWIHFQESGWLHSWAYSFTSLNGDPVPRAVLHHLKVLSLEQRELFTPIVLHVVGAGEETDPVVLPNNLGYRLEAGDSLLVTAMLHNPTDTDLRGVTMEVTLRYSVDGSWRPPLEVMPFFVHVTTDLSLVDFDVPPGVSERSVVVTPSIDCRVLALGAHLHRYGRRVTLTDLTDGKVLWEGDAKLSDDGTVLKIPQDYFVWSGGLELKKDRTYEISTVYENPTGDTIAAGGMATLGGVVVPGEPWPKVDPFNDEYRWYLERELTWNPGHSHG